MINPEVTLMVTIGWDHVARIWDVSSGQQVQICEGHADSILNATISPDGKWLGTVSEDYTARLWPLNSIRHKIPVKVTEP
jgi:WD40 repeat protein